MSWKNPWNRKKETEQMSTVRVDKKVKKRWMNMMQSKFGVNWQYHHGEHFSKALDMYLDFLDSVNGEVEEGDKKEIIGCYALINLLQDDLTKEIRKHKNIWINERKKQDNKKVGYLDGVIKGLNIAFNKTKLVRSILKEKE